MTISRTTTASASRDRSASKAALLRAALTLCTGLVPVWALADTLPTGGSVVQGSASISTPAPNAMVINQSSNTAIVNWNGFSIGQGSSVDIRQPGSDAAILNRVTGSTTSQIHGQLNANGRVFVVNPNGIFIGPTGHVNAGGFVASTLDIRNDDFATGQLVFEGDGASATVSNAGTVEVVSGGYAALIGGRVRNSGTIQAPLGFVGLGSGERVTLDLSGDGFLQVALPTDSEDDGLEALIENSGTIQANGGTVQISAATARNAARHAINLSGVVEARTVSGRNGRITLGGGGGGKVTVSGKVRASARRPAIQVTESRRPAARPERGGDITITGNDITLAGADIDASGIDGGGRIRIGGAFQGGSELPAAQTLTVDAATTLSADALTQGDGGRIILWSDHTTDYAGNLSVRGGALEGDGGFAEVSGKVNLNYAGFADGRAPNGKSGELLLDPTNIEIVGTDPGLNQILNTDLQTQLATMSVTIATSGAGATFAEAGEPGIISVNAPLSWNATTFLALAADSDVIVNAAITSPLGSLSLFSGTDIDLSAPISVPNGNFLIGSTGSGGYVYADSSASVDADLFRLLGFTDWVQNVPVLPSFDANNFVLEPDSTFLRVTGGSGGSGSPYQVADVYGLQGMGSIGSGSWELVNDIDASVTSNWSSLDAPVNGQVDQGFVPYSFSGSLNGNRHTISNLFSRRYGATNGGAAGMFDDISPNGVVVQLNLTDVDIAGTQVGGLAAYNDGNVLGVSVEGDITVLNEISSGTFGGGIVGYNESGLIGASFADVTITDEDDPSQIYTGPSESHYIGGIAGISDGEIITTRSSGNISYDNATVGYVGGIVGLNENEVSDSYSTASVSGDTNTGVGAYVGGISGDNRGTLLNVIANGPVSVTGSNIYGSVGAVTGGDDSSDQSILASFYSVAGTGQATSGEVGEDNGLSPGIGQPFEGAIADTVVPLTDATLFTFGASIAGWNFDTVWAFPQDGVDQARLVTVDPVIGVINQPESTPSVQYQGAGGTSYTATDSQYSGGPASYFFGPLGDTGDLSEMDSQLTLSGTDVGSQTYRYPFTYASDLGQVFDVRSFDQDITITPAPLLVSVEDTNKLYGTTLGFSDVNFSTDTLFAGDSITGGTILSSGSAASAPVSETPYTLSVDDLSGPGLGNYTIEINSGDLFVTPRSLDVSLDDASKLYGETVVFDGTEFTVTGLIGSDSLTSLTITSDGAEAAAQVAGSPYLINGDDPVGTGLANYLINFIPGDLTVTPVPLVITVDDQTKTYGGTFTFNGTEFTVSGLVGSDSVDSLTLTSDGAASTAQVAGSPFDIDGSDPVGTGIGNYTVSIIPGQLVVTPLPLVIDIDDQSKIYGETVTFNGTEFTVSGLIGSDSVDSLTLTSDGTASTAQVAGSPFDIDGSDPVGMGIGNYTVSINAGQLVVTPAPLVIDVDDQTKTYGDTFTFNGTEFAVSGLIGSDSVDSLTLTSDGAASTAQVAGSPFDIDGSDPVGTGIGNYTISINGGQMVVTPAPLTITAEDQNKPFGTEFTFTGNEFTVAGLQNNDTLDSATLTSTGAPAAAAPTGETGVAILISDPLGTGLENYEVTLVNGIMVIAPGNLVITANDQTKAYGDTFTFDGTEFSVSGLVNGDSVDSVTLTSAGADAGAQVANSPFAISASDPVGSGLENYTVSFVPGDLTVTPAPLTITIDDQTKTYGSTFTFNGTEFTVSGLIGNDSVDSLTLTSDGAALTAQVADSPYDINGSDPVGMGVTNYSISYVPGQLTVTPAPLTITADDQTKEYGTEFTFVGNEFTVTGLLNEDTVESATLTSEGAAASAPFTGEEGVAILITDPLGTGLENYEVTLVEGVLIVAPANLVITANDQTKNYGDTFVFDGTEFTVTGLVNGDSVDSVTLTSAGADATAQVADGPFVISASDAVGSGLEAYTLTYADGSMAVAHRSLTITADDQTKQQGIAFTFTGTEFSTSGLVNGDTVDNVALFSLGADAEALADDSPFDILVGEFTGRGLENYEIATVDGIFTVNNNVAPPLVNPLPPGNIGLPNPTDTVTIAFPGSTSTVSGGAGGSPQSGTTPPGAPQQNLSDAQRTLEVVDTLSTDLELAVQSCGNADQDFTKYMACLSDSLDTYANALDQIANDLPSGLETVSATIRTASAGVKAATARAQRRLAGATSAAERQAIQREAIAEARGAIATAQTEIRKAISLIRAEDPEVQSIQQQTGARIVQAFDTVDSALARAVEL